jgi:hypothetical protein
MIIEQKEVSLPAQRLSDNLIKHLTDGHHHTINASNVFVDLDPQIGLMNKGDHKEQFDKYSVTDQYTTKQLFDLLRNGEGYLTVASNKPQPDGREFHWFVKLKKEKKCSSVCQVFPD